MKVALSPLYLSVEEVRFVFQERSEFPRVFLKNNFTVYPCGRGEMLKTKAFVLEIKMDPAVGFHNPSVKTYLEKKNFFIMADIIYIHSVLTIPNNIFRLSILIRPSSRNIAAKT